ncbi:effector binding domain-containing protein [Bacillus horti]|uniref:Transcriptional regulator YdeE n=1 Tax=Caldalkalibacillus horti TaxID=77523 RepID=A0ABT9W3I5_9BACI|nr:effector binding domain-containing protein [Bacillus horti]MDQ0167814.1 putative transcriptional regulator YdeE [Bacillus horti]
MECKDTNLTYQIIGTKYTGRFNDYPVFIPNASEEFKTKYKEAFGDESFLRAIVYEPKREESQETGYFYIGAVVEETPNHIPEGMERLQIQGSYGSIRAELDFSKMGEYYNTLINWITNKGLKMHPTEHLIELYHPNTNYETELEIYIPLMDEEK